MFAKRYEIQPHWWDFLWIVYLINPGVKPSSTPFHWRHGNIWWATHFLDLIPFLLDLDLALLHGVQRPSPCDTWGFPPSHSQLFLISTFHTSSGLSQLRRGPTWCQPGYWGHLTTILLAHSFSRLCPTTISCIHLASCLVTRCPSTTSCIHLVSISKAPPYVCLSTDINSFLHSCGFNIWALPLASPQLLACIVIWVQCLGFTPHLSTTSCAHLVSISNFPFPPMCFSTSCIHLVSYVAFPPSPPTTSCIHLVPISKAHPYVCLSTASCTHAVSIYKLFLSSLHSFLHASSFGFNV